MKIARKQKARITHQHLQPINQLWKNFVNMSDEDHKIIKSYIESFNDKNIGFIEYKMKSLLLEMHSMTECYHKKCKMFKDV